MNYLPNWESTNIKKGETTTNKMNNPIILKIPREVEGGIFRIIGLFVLFVYMVD